MKLNRNEKAIFKIITENYFHKTTIKDVFNCSYETAKEIFDLAKAEEMKKSMIDVRPNAVQSRLVLKVTGTNRNFLKKQFDELLELKGINLG